MSSLRFSAMVATFFSIWGEKPPHLLKGSGNCSALTSKSGVSMRLCIIERKKNPAEVGQSCDWGKVRVCVKTANGDQTELWPRGQHTHCSGPLKKASGKGKHIKQVSPSGRNRLPTTGSSTAPVMVGGSWLFCAKKCIFTSPRGKGEWAD